MRRVRLLSALLVTLSMVAAIVATSATAALPEFSPPFPKPFVSESGPSVFETVGAAKIECVADKNFGAFTNPTEGNVTIVFTGCELALPAGKVPCNTETAAPEEIVTNSLAAKLGYITHTPLKGVVGLELGFGEAPIAFITCGNVHVLIIGSFIGKITPLNKPVKPFPGGHFTVVFKQAKGKQKPKHFEGMPPDLFLTTFGGPFEETGFASKDKLGFPEVVTILA
jgi:hypothetical protein